MLSQQGLPSHHTSELRGENCRPTPAPQLGSLSTLWPLWHWGRGPGQCGDAPRGSFGNSKGAWHRVQDTGGIRQSLCLEEEKNRFPQDGSQCRHCSQEPKFKAGIGVLDPEITFLPFSLSLIFHFQQKEEDISECRGVHVYTHNGARVPVCACMWKPQDRSWDQGTSSYSP